MASWPWSNRQYSYSPTVLGRVGLDHECEPHAGNFSPRGQTNMRKLRLSLPNLRKIVNIVKFQRAYTLERNHYFKQQRKICSLLLRKTDPNQNYIDDHFNCNFQCPLNFLKNIFYWHGRNYRKPAIKLTVMLSHLLCSWNFLTERM